MMLKFPSPSICSCITFYLGFVFLTQMGSDGTSYVWLSGGETFDISSTEINTIVEENIFWIFNTNISHTIRVSFIHFDFQPGYAFMDIGDGTSIDTTGARFKNPSSYTRLASFGGSVLPSVLTSVGNSLWIRIKSSPRKGWSMNFNMTIISTNTSDIKLLKRGEMISIRSLNYPDNYPNNYYRLWNILAPPGSVISVTVREFNIENGNDHLYIGDGVNSFTNQLGSWRGWTGELQDEGLALYDFISTTSSITMIFTTDFSTSRKRFWIQLQAVDDSTKITTGVMMFSNASATRTTPSASDPATDSSSLTDSRAGISKSSTNGIILDHHLDHNAFIYKLAAFISSSILFMIIIGYASYRCRGWCNIRREDKRYNSVSFRGSPNRCLQAANVGGNRPEGLNAAEALPLTATPYETIPGHFLPPQPHPSDAFYHLQPTSVTDDVRTDDAGYMVPDQVETEDRSSSVTPGTMARIHHTYFDTTLGDILPFYETSIPETNIQEVSDELSSSHGNLEVTPVSASTSVLNALQMEVGKTPHYVNMPRSLNQESVIALGNLGESKTDKSSNILDQHTSCSNMGSMHVDDTGYVIIDE